MVAYAAQSSIRQYPLPSPPRPADGSNPLAHPVRAYRARLQAAGITEGPAFRKIDRHGKIGADALCDHSVAFVITRTIVAGEIGNGASEQEAAEVAKRFAGALAEVRTSNVRGSEPRAWSPDPAAATSQKV